ncbi:MAG: hypothetical protein IT435_02510 [Phycisphaerales bacterium]|nr:hypothetical protein [Phycisphaerales bacterium]
MKPFTLAISPNYVQHWGLWEAVREVYQNALDEGEAGASTSIRHAKGVLSVSTNRGRLTPQTLLLGQTTKTGTSARGQFGEGYKLALLVLTRLGHPVTIYNGDVAWEPKIERDDHFGCEVLRIYVRPLAISEGDGVTFRIGGVSDEQWSDIDANIHPITDRDAILEGESQRGRIYVGGLFVRRMEKFRYGYALAAKTLRLDRDRGMVHDFDLSLVTSRLWTDRQDSPEAYALLKEGAPDVQYLTSHVTKQSAVVATVAQQFDREHGANTVPVSTQAEVERATASGRPWALVPETLKNVVAQSRDIYIPMKGMTALERLRKFNESYRWRFTDEMRRDMEDILTQMEGTA